MVPAMSASTDVLLGQAAIARGLLTRERLDEALARRDATAAGSALGPFLVRAGWITPDQLLALAREVESMRAKTRDGAQGDTLIEDDRPAPSPGPDPADVVKSRGFTPEPGAPPRPSADASSAHAARGVATLAGGPASASTPGSLEGGRFGKYRLEERIGQGGMGAVYRAVDTELHRTVAVKVLLGADDTGDERVRRFQREAETAGKLRHPHIVTIFEVGCEAGHHYFAMEYVEGASLSQLLYDKQLRLDDAVDIFLQVVEAIDYAHRHQVIHRDLKPQNIMVDRERRAYVTDFGLAKELTARTRLTQTGKLMGTPMYMAPEQANAEAGKIDALTDVYALGAVLYEILTGRPPFDGASPAEIVYAVLFKDPAPPTSLNRRVPVDLETICLKALEKERERRYAGAGELAADLKRFREGEAIRAKPASRLSRVLRRVRRHRGATLGVAAAFAVAAIAVGWAGVHSIRSAERERRVAEQEERTRRDREAMDARRKAQESAAALLVQAEREEGEGALALLDRAVALDPDSVAVRLRRAKRFAKLDRDAEAIADLDHVLARDPENLQALYERSQIHGWSARDHAKAEQDILAMLALDPEDVLALESQGCLLLIRGRNLDALAPLTRAIEKDPARWSPYYYRGTAKAVGRDLAGAVQDLTDALERRPDDPAMLLTDRAKYRNWMLEANEALADAEQALRLGPNNARALSQKGTALGLLGRRAEALQAAREAIALAPNEAEMYARLGQVHRSFNELDAALEAGARALQVDPRCVMARHLRAEILTTQGRHADAIAECDAVLADSEHWHDAHLIKAEALLELGDLGKAMTSIDRAIAMEPDEPNGYSIRSRIHGARGDRAAMQIDLQRHIDLMSARKIDSPAFHVVLGRALGLAGRFEEGIARYTKAIDRDPNFAEAYKDRAALLIQVRRLDLAARDAQKYVELRPEEFDAHRLQGLVHLVQNRPAEAVRSYEEAVRVRPAGSTEVWNNLAHAYNVMGRVPDAVQALERGLALDATNDGILFNLACLQAKTGKISEGIESLAKAIENGYDHWDHLRTDPDLDPMEATPAFAPAIVEACLNRATGMTESARSVMGYAPVQARLELERAADVLSFAATLAEAAPSRSTRVRVFWLRSTVWRYLKARAKEIADLERAAALDPSYESRLRHAVGLRELDEGRPADAVREFTAALETEPGLADARCDRGKAKLLLGDRAGALEDLEAGFQKRPELKPYYQTEWLRAKAE